MIPFMRPKPPGESDIVLVRYVKNDRSPLCVYNIGDIAGFERPIAEALIRQGFAVLHDCGKGPGVVNPDEVVHLPEPWEQGGDWASFHSALSGKK